MSVSTKPKNANVKYFYALISFLLKNIWMYIQRKHFTIVKRRPKVADKEKFRNGEIKRERDFSEVLKLIGSLLFQVGNLELLSRYG